MAEAIYLVTLERFDGTTWELDSSYVPRRITSAQATEEWIHMPDVGSIEHDTTDMPRRQITRITYPDATGALVRLVYTPE